MENNKIVTLDNRRSYVILDQINYDNETYCFITDVIDENSFFIIRKSIMDNHCVFTFLNDADLEVNLKGVFANRLGIEM